MSCKNFHISPSFVVNDSSTQVVFTFPNAVSAVDKDRFCMKIVTSLPEGKDTYTAYVQVNGSNIPLVNKYGNYIVVSDLRKCAVYKGYYGSTVPHVIFNEFPRNINTGCGNVL